MALLLLLLLLSQVRLAVFSQHHVDGLDLALSPLQIMVNSYAGEGVSGCSTLCL